MKKLTIPMLAVAGALSALQAHGDDRQIDWSMVPGGHGRNDVSRDFVASPDVLNTVLSNSFTAWEPRQKIFAQARTSTGRDQRRAVVGNPNETAVTENVSYTSETIVTSQAAPSSSNQPTYSENTNQSGTQAQTENRSQDQNARSSGTSDTSAQNTAATSGASTTAQNKTNANQMSDANKMAAKSNLAPHALIIESSLNSAMNQVKGMKGEMEVTQDLKKADKMAVQGYKDFIKEMKNDINVARTHERQMMSHIHKYPEVANSSEFKSVNPALRNLQTSLKQWESKANNAQYWNNQQQAKTDLDQIQKQLSNALDKVKSFNSSQFNATSTG